MQMRHSTLVLSKNQAAVRQTEAAIDAFQRGDFDICITLAGAAEGIYSTRKGSDMFSYLISHAGALERYGSKRWNRMLNRERDWLKHATEGEPQTLTLEAFDAAAMIARAASKLDQSSWTPKMHEFREWFVAECTTTPEHLLPATRVAADR